MKKFAALCSGMLLVFTVVLVVDTTDYRDAVSAFETKEVLKKLAASKDALEGDLARYQECEAMKREAPNSEVHVHIPEAKKCLITNGPKTQTAMGAIAFAAGARQWIESHGEEKDVVDAALQAISNGRSELIAVKPWYFDNLERIAQANDNSFIRRSIFGKQNTSSLFMTMMEKLTMAEYQVVAPEVSRRQEAWLTQAFKPMLESR